MYIEEYAKKQLFGSIDKNKIPANLADYNCELIIEDYAQVAVLLFRAGRARSSPTSGSRPSRARLPSPSPSKSTPSPPPKISSIPTGSASGRTRGSS